MDFVKPTIEYADIWPLILVFGVACVGVVVEAFVPRAHRFLVQTVLAGAGIVAALVGTVMVARERSTSRAPSPSTARPSSSGD